jgi:L-threonylcarbamoyladenylate synthase
VTLRLRGSDSDDLDTAVELLRAGGVVAFPTETVYGLGADGLAAEAVARIFEAKGRPADNPLILHVGSFAAARALWRTDAGRLALAHELAEAFWPGPLTLVLPSAPGVPALVTAGQDTVAVRMPDHPVALDLLARFGGPLAAPSANRSGRPSPTTAAHVLATLDGRIDAVVDGGPTRVGVESTVLALDGERPRLLRPGSITAEQLRVHLPTLDDGAPSETDLARSPGLRHRHYAPAGVALELVDGAALEDAWPQAVTLLCRASTAARLEAQAGARAASTEVLPDDPAGFARALYAALHRLEGARAERALIEAPPPGEAWAAVRDRLQRAAQSGAVRSGDDP